MSDPIWSAFVFGSSARPCLVHAHEQPMLADGLRLVAPERYQAHVREVLPFALRGLEGTPARPCAGLELTFEQLRANPWPVSLDLAAAVALLRVHGVCAPAPERVAHTMFCARLDPRGRLVSTRGILPMAQLARQRGMHALVVPRAQMREAAPIEGLEVYGFEHLRELVGWWRTEGSCPGWTRMPPRRELDEDAFDLAQLPLEEAHKQALEVACVHESHVLLHGGLGCGAAPVARRLVGLRAPMGLGEQLEVSVLHSVAGRLRPGQGRCTARPYQVLKARGTLTPGMVLRGRHLGELTPGPVGLAHRGVLYVEQLPELAPRTQRALAEVLEQGHYTLSTRGARGQPRRARLEARPQLIASMWACPCGRALTRAHDRCTCSPKDIKRYRARIVPELWAHFELHLDLSRVDWTKAGARALSGAGTASRRARVQATRRRQRLDGSSAAASPQRRVARTLAELHARPTVEVAHHRLARRWTRAPWARATHPVCAPPCRQEARPGG